MRLLSINIFYDEVIPEAVLNGNIFIFVNTCARLLTTYTNKYDVTFFNYITFQHVG